MLTKHRAAAGALSLVAAAGLALSGCGNSTSTASSPTGKVTLTFWENYGTQLSLLNTAKNLIRAYEKLHPNVTIKMVSQPANNYFALLQASAISHTGPDLAVMWTGLYLPPYAEITGNVRPYIPQSVLSNIEGLQWGAQNFDASKAILAMPVDAQFYMGFYNKKDFAKAGIKQVAAGLESAVCGVHRAQEGRHHADRLRQRQRVVHRRVQPLVRLQLSDDRLAEARAVGGPV